MAQALLIKTANTTLKTVGDIIPGGIFEDTHKFTENELLEYSVAKIAGTRKEVIEKLWAIRAKIETAYKACDALWSRTPPEEKEVWLDTDEKWYFLEIAPKYKYSMALLSIEEKTILETATTGLERDTIYQKMIVNPGVWNRDNAVEAADLNSAVMAEL